MQTIGHKGKDGRYYVIDTARLFPPIPPTDSCYAVSMGVDEQRVDHRRYRMGSLNITTLMVYRYLRDAAKVLRCEKVKQIPVPVIGGSVVYDSELADRLTDPDSLEAMQQINRMASLLVGRTVYGPSLYIPPGYLPSSSPSYYPPLFLSLSLFSLSLSLSLSLS